MSFTEALPGALPAAPTSLVDTKKISAHLAKISAIEKGWSLPAIPDLVKLDLASNSPDKESLNSLLYGLEHDLKTNDSAETPGFTPIPVHNGRTVAQEIANQWGGWTGLRPPQQADVDAVSIFKADAVRQGLLPADTVIDSRWDPAYASIQHDMLQTQYDDRMGGNRPGAASWQKVASVFADWGSPTGLLRAAVSLDLMWDFKAIGSETQHWGDKWRKIGDSKNPWDFGRNLFDALTGPIDDVIVPVLNDILLVTGVSEAYSFARLTMAARKGIEFAEVAKDLYQGARVVEDAGFIQKWRSGIQARALSDAEAFTKPSWLAKHSRGFGSHVMEPWRKLPTTLITKKAVQTTMKFGLVSRLEDSVLPNQSGLSLGSVPGVQKNVDDFTQNPFVYLIGETFFTPSTIFGHGAVTRWAKSASSKALTTYEHTVGPAAGFAAHSLEHIGWKKYNLQNLSRKLSILDFKRVTGEEKIVGAFVRAHLTHLADEPERLAKFTDILRKEGGRAAMRWHTGLSEEDLGAAMSYAIMNAGHDLPGKVKLVGMGIEDGEERGYTIYHTLRDKSIAQVRKWDPGDRSSLLAHAALFEGGSDKVIAERFARMMADPLIDDVKLEEMAFTHNALADTHRNQLLAHVTPEVLEAYLPNVMPTFGNWSPFVETQQMLHDYNSAGLFDGARFVGAEEAPLRVAASNRGNPLDSVIGKSVPTSDAGKFIAKNSYAPLARGINPTSGRFTTAGPGTLVKKEVIDTADAIRVHLGHRRIFDQIAEVDRKLLRHVDEKLGEVHLDLSTASSRTVENMIKTGYSDAAKATKGATAVGEGTGRVTVSAKQLKMIRKYMTENGVTFDQIAAHLDETTAQLEHTEEWGSRFGFGSVVKDKEGRVLAGADALKVRVGQLMHKSNFTAAEVDMDHLLSQYAVGSEEHTKLLAMQAKFEESGDRLVHGVEFSSPIDLLDRGMPFSARGGVAGLYPDITQRHLNGIRLGNFVTAHEDNPAFRALQRRSLRMKLAEEFDALKARSAKTGEAIHPALAELHYHHPAAEGDVAQLINPDAPDLDALVHDLYENLISPTSQAAADARLQYATGNLLKHTLRSVQTPKSIAELGINFNKGRLMGYLAPKYGDAVALAAWKAIKRSRVGGFESMGLASLEQKFRSSPIAVNALKTLGGVGAHPKAYARVVGGIVGSTTGAVLAGDQDPGIRGGAALFGGAVGMLAGPKIAQGIGKIGVASLADRLEHSARWARYGYLGDEIMQHRDILRFGLSPMFDLYRYAHGQVFGITEDIGLRINQTPSALRRAYAKEHMAAGVDRATARVLAKGQWEEALTRYRAVAHGEHDFEAIDDGQKWFNQVGILGYDHTKMEASTFAQLTGAGMDSKEAYSKVRLIYGYGEHGRSALNKSINTLFFPFSFQAKQTKAIAGFLAKDWSRAVAVHDAYRTYELLNDKFDLNKIWHDHLPALEVLQRLNFFAHGISPGIMGGLNRPFIDVATSVGDPIRNFFTPQAGHASPDLMKAVKKLLPAYNDINYMVQAVKEQGHVVFSPSHEIEATEASDGFVEWNAYKKSVEEALKSKGYKWNDIYNKDELAGLGDAVTKKRFDLQTKYPGWKSAMETSVYNAQAINQEMRQRDAMYRNGTPINPESDQAFMEFNQVTQLLDDFMTRNNLSIRDDMDKLPLEMIDMIREAAVAYASEPGEAGRGFKVLYEKYWKKRFGPIMRDV